MYTIQICKTIYIDYKKQCTIIGMEIIRQGTSIICED